jgi:oligopeptidase A
VTQAELITTQLAALHARPVPNFAALDADVLADAVAQTIDASRATIDSHLDTLAGLDAASLEQALLPLERCMHDVDSCFSPLRHMHAVVDTPAIRNAYEISRAKLTAFYTTLGQDPRVFALLSPYEDNAPPSTPAQPSLIAAVRLRLRDMRLTGAGLDADTQALIAKHTARLSELQSKFSTNVLDASEGWAYHVTDKATLAGLPDSVLAAAHREAKTKGINGWLLGLDFPMFYAIQRFAQERDIREVFYRAWNTRASSEFGPSPAPGPDAMSAAELAQFDNAPVMDEILALRHEMARLLGFGSFADLSLATKMADSPSAVLEFLNDLAARAVPAAREDVHSVQAFADKASGPRPLAAWDFAFYAERMREQEMALDQEALRPYFPLTKVLDGLFAVLQQLFAVTIARVEDSTVSTWHRDARLFTVNDADGSVRGYFYLDLFAREGKRGGAWMDECRCRHQFDDDLQVPVAYLTCNFAPPNEAGVALLTHDEVLTLFHETGHGIHHLLTEIEVPSVGGINGVAWDAVELPSQLLENWCWETESLQGLTAHVETGEPLDDATIERLRNSRTFMAGYAFARQLEFALFDMRLHFQYPSAPAAPATAVSAAPASETAASNTANWVMQTLNSVRAEVAVLPNPEYNRFAHAFTHIFGGGYAAGYYSYKWAELLSSDAFSRFEDDGLFDQQAGQAFREHVLARGGTEPAQVLYERFRGRPASIAALLRHNGL